MFSLVHPLHQISFSNLPLAFAIEGQDPEYSLNLELKMMFVAHLTIVKLAIYQPNNV
jgi:hypothetical protein